MNIIGDIAGNYKTLRALLKKMPDEEPISVGDMVDRGPRSKEVLEFFMDNGRAVAGNHEEMMLYSVLREEAQPGTMRIWMYNGGGATYKNYMDGSGDLLIPVEHVEWLRKLPLYIEEDGLLITHAPRWSDTYPDPNVLIPEEAGKNAFLWNRHVPVRRYQDGVNIFGHNGDKEVKWYQDESGQPYAVCIDTSWAKILTGIHWPTMKIYQQEYID